MNKIDLLLVVIFLTLSSTPAHSQPHISDFQPDYKEVLKLSILYYEAQRSGKLPSSNRIKWRGDSALQDRGQNGEDLTGGYYDANDFVKFSFTMAFTTTILSWGVLLYKDAYEKAGQYSEVLDAIKWSTDYFIKCHVSPNEFYGQVGDFAIDHSFWGRPEDMNLTRPTYKIDENHPGSDLAGEASAVFSSASLVFRNKNSTYSRELLKHSEELYKFAKEHEGLQEDIIPGAKHRYELKSFTNELIWASTWLFKATGNRSYIMEAEKYYKNSSSSQKVPKTFFYNRKLAGVQILLAETTKSNYYYEASKIFCDHAVDYTLKTIKGLIFIEKFWTLSHAANIAFACLRVAEFPNMPKEKYLKLAKKQIDYMLGSTGRNFVVGYGRDYPKRPYHSASSCPDRPLPCGWDQFHSTLPNPQILYGALVSGPNMNDHFEDRREEFLYSDVTLDSNAGFQSALAGLIHFGF